MLSSGETLWPAAEAPDIAEPPVPGIQNRHPQRRDNEPDAEGLEPRRPGQHLQTDSLHDG